MTAMLRRAASAPARMQGNHGNLEKLADMVIPNAGKKRGIVGRPAEEGQYQRTLVATCVTAIPYEFRLQRVGPFAIVGNRLWLHICELFCREVPYRIL